MTSLHAPILPLDSRKPLVVLTGAGISAESGLPTFRGADGLWEGRSVFEVATPEGYRADPVASHRFYNQRRAKLASVEPNAAHRALARLEGAWPGGGGGGHPECGRPP